ncbi:MAG: CtsR family transcriptional regulator [Clostridia bacterium]|nr:CtsR family transcriptional regulator [Clostridia bacterium]
MNLSNVIAAMISDMLEENNEIEIQRNILAQDLGCVPSQINYVLSSRFTPERGYMVESRRGGGGFVKITRIVYDKDTLIHRIFSSVGDSIDAETAKAHTLNLLRQKIISEPQAELIFAAISEAPYRRLPPQIRDTVRADMFKQILLSVSK